MQGIHSGTDNFNPVGPVDRLKTDGSTIFHRETNGTQEFRGGFLCFLSQVQNNV